MRLFETAWMGFKSLSCCKSTRSSIMLTPHNAEIINKAVLEMEPKFNISNRNQLLIWGRCFTVTLSKVKNFYVSTLSWAHLQLYLSILLLVFVLLLEKRVWVFRSSVILGFKTVAVMISDDKFSARVVCSQNNVFRLCLVRVANV